MAIYTDQAFGGNFDPGNPGGLPTSVTVISITLNDADNDNLIESNGSDQVNGSNVVNVWVNDTVTMTVVIGGASTSVTYTGTTFYTADGSRYFTPNDNSVLLDGTVTSVTYVSTSTEFPVGDLGPPCFTAGTYIETPDGEVQIQDLEVGDLVNTKDHGPQPIRWIGRRVVAGRGEFAPILFKAGAIGNTRDLRVSPQHRMLLQDWRAELFFGEDEVLCAANKLLNDTNILKAPCESVEYIHLMFDQHEVIYAEGAPTESFLVGEYLCGEGSELLNEIRSLFPEFNDAPAHHIAARRVARGFEMTAIAA